MSDPRTDAISAFGASAKAKLHNLAAKGEPEDQLRAPLEQLFADLAAALGNLDGLALVGETSVAALKARPDYAVTLASTLVGHIELKAPGKGADPRRFKDKHDKAQWDKLKALPNLLYTDGNEFTLWRNGDPVGDPVKLHGDIASAGDLLAAPASFLALVRTFLGWAPIPPNNPLQLAEISARLCKLLRDEVAEQLAQRNPSFTDLANDWRQLLFPEASDKEFADGYAQAVTFGLLMARVRKIKLADGLGNVSKELGRAHSLIGAALRLLTDDAENQRAIQTSLDTLTRVLDAVDWDHLTRHEPEAWLYFYEHFLGVYDNDLRKLTGSYYTPPQVVNAMVRWVDEVLRSRARFNLNDGLAAPSVTIADPAVGTGTFMLGVLRYIAQRVEDEQGAGAVPAAVEAAVQRLIGFELQLGPFVVAQLRLLGEVADLLGYPPKAPLRMFVADTLANPYAEEGWIPATLKPLAESRRQASKIKREEAITVVIGNPPYKEKAMGRGGWVESGEANSPEAPPLDQWMPPREWGVGAHSKHLRNLYVYFWRWATWKVFDRGADPKGVVCFITVAGFLNGPGFQKMRDDLRRSADEIWVVDCSPEGHQPEVPTRIFEGVQQPVCIVLASRAAQPRKDTPAKVHFRRLPAGPREQKFSALDTIRLDGEGWSPCPNDWRAPFLPADTGAWSRYPALEDLFDCRVLGVQPGRTWIIAPDAASLAQRWDRLTHAPRDQQEALFYTRLKDGEPDDKHIWKVVNKSLAGQPPRPLVVAEDRGPCIPPVRYAYRSFDRQYILPDNRLMNRPNPTLWAWHSDKQLYATALRRTSPSVGPALTFTALIPDYDHYNMRGGRVLPLWKDKEGRESNVLPALLGFLGGRWGREVSGEEVMAYVAAVAAHPGYVERFREALATPGLRIPLTGDAGLFGEAVALGREVVWLHTFGERCWDEGAGRPARAPRLPKERAPSYPREGMIPTGAEEMPDELSYDAARRRLCVGAGYIENVSPEVWEYEVSGKRVLRQWFSYRKRDRAKPVMGDRRPPSALDRVQPEGWLAEYTAELLNVLHVLGLLVEREPAQAALLERICEGPLLEVEVLRAEGALVRPAGSRRGGGEEDEETGQMNLLG